MSKRRGAKAADIESKTSGSASKPSEPATADATLDENSFKHLKDKISAQLKNVNTNNKDKKARLKKGQGKQDIAARGKKRTVDGTVIALNGTHGTKPDPIASQADEGDDEQELQKALKDLGGTQEDLELIAGADSESELEGLNDGTISKQHSKKGSSLENGIANILREIALARGDQQDGVTDSEDDQEHDIDNSSGDPKAVMPEKSTPTSKSTEKISSRKGVDSRFKCQPRADWFNVSTYEANPDLEPKHKPSQKAIEQLYSHAKSLLQVENDVFKTTQQSSSSQAFYNTVIASGTLSDKISALTLAVQESPLHNVKALEDLISLAAKRNRGQAIDVLRALKDLFAQGSLLPSSRRLYTFATQPALLSVLSQTKAWTLGDRLPSDLQETDLICWVYEDWLKQQYFEILKIIETWCGDEIEFAKGRAVSYVYELLKEKPEQESNLLRLLINKLGDPVKKIASQASYLIMQLLSTHPAMKLVVISAIEADFIFRPGQSMHGIYYAAVTLNQTALSAREEDVAKKLLSIYFTLFTILLKSSDQEPTNDKVVDSQTRAQRQRKRKTKTSETSQDEELREKLISAVLTGVNRAYPYVGTDEKSFGEHLETLFKITHSANFNTSIQAMLLIQQLSSTHSASADRFYKTLYESLLDPRLITASKQQLYLNLLHRSLKADLNTKRVKAFAKRLLQILSLHEAPFICGVFFLLKDLERTYSSLAALVDQAEDHEDTEEVFRDVDEDSVALDLGVVDGKPKNSYDGYKRAPEHANADNSCAWELLPFLAHFHPAINVSADCYLKRDKLPGKPDLTLHTLIHFRDRFVYRNPKLGNNRLRGSSIMQPMASDDAHAVLISSVSRQSVPAVNTNEFRTKKDGDVAAEDVFFHKYFTTLGKDIKVKKPKAQDIDEDGSVGDEGEDAVWKAMMDSAPDLEGEGSEDEDMDMSDLEEAMSDESEIDEPGTIDSDDDDEVDIEAGIFDESDDEMLDVQTDVHDEQAESESEFGGLDSDVAEGEDARARRKKDKRKADKDKRKKMKALPTFASAADYAKMLEDDEDEDLG